MSGNIENKNGRIKGGLFGMNYKLHPAWKELFKVAKEWEYGSFHSHEEIASIINQEMQTQAYYQTVNRANRELLRQANRCLSPHQTEGGKRGYRVLLPSEHLLEAQRLTRQAAKKLGKSYSVATATPLHMLDEQQRERLINYIERQNILRAFFVAKAGELAAVAKGKELPVVERVKMF
jgi:hypothetical protein